MRTINLLPPEAKQKAAARRKQSLWIVLGVVYLVILALITLWYQGRVDSAQDAVDAQQVVVDDLRTDVARLADLATLQETFLTQAVIVQTVLADDIAWGRLLNDFGRLIPPRVWLATFNGVAAATGAGGVGSLTIAGVAFDYPDVASWLRSLDSTNFPGVDQTWVNSASAGTIGAFPVVDFASSTLLTDEALSDRAETRIPDVP
jgi:Tfp pilus assembly protein PilN